MIYSITDKANAIRNKGFQDLNETCPLHDSNQSKI